MYYYTAINLIRYLCQDIWEQYTSAVKNYNFVIFKDVLAVTDTYNDKLYFFNKTSGDQVALPFEVDDETFYSVVTYNLDNQPLGPDNSMHIVATYQLPVIRIWPCIHQLFLRIFLVLSSIMSFVNHSYKWYFTFKFSQYEEILLTMQPMW